MLAFAVLRVTKLEDVLENFFFCMGCWTQVPPVPDKYSATELCPQSLKIMFGFASVSLSYLD